MKAVKPSEDPDNTGGFEGCKDYFYDIPMFLCFLFTIGAAQKPAVRTHLRESVLFLWLFMDRSCAHLLRSAKHGLALLKSISAQARGRRTRMG